jgi:hypothetical protein
MVLVSGGGRLGGAVYSGDAIKKHTLLNSKSTNLIDLGFFL